MNIRLADSTPGTSAFSSGRRRGSRRPADLGPVGIVLSVIALLFLGLPVVALLARAVLSGELIAQASEKAVLDALVLSLVTTLASLVLAVAFGTPLALLLARREFRGKGLVEAIIDLPIVLPPTVAGLALLLVLGRRGVVGSSLDAVGISIPFTIVAVVLAQTFVAAPLYIRSVRAGFTAVDPTVEEAAEVDGAGRMRAPHPGHHAARRAGRGWRAGARVGTGTGRVRGDHHVRGQHRGPHPDPAPGRLLRVPGEPRCLGRRGRSARAGRAGRAGRGEALPLAARPRMAGHGLTARSVRTDCGASPSA